MTHQVSIDGIENVPRDRGCVYMSNHQSVFDTAAAGTRRCGYAA